MRSFGEVAGYSVCLLDKVVALLKEVEAGDFVTFTGHQTLFAG